MNLALVLFFSQLLTSTLSIKCPENGESLQQQYFVTAVDQKMKLLSI